MRNTIRKILKEEAEGGVLKYALKKMVDAGMLDMEVVNVYDNNFEVYGFEGVQLEYFMDNHIIFEKGGPSELFLNFQMYEDEIDMKEALDVINWLYPKLDELFDGKIGFMDNLEDDEY